MKNNAVKRILLCVAGGTPQIITETLWALIDRGERVDEIRVITTLEGRRILQQKIFDNGKFEQFCGDFPEARSVRFDRTSLENHLYILTNKDTGVPSPRDSDKDRLRDILTREDNEKAASQICEIVRELTRNPSTIVHASVAGGRKTMGIYLTAAMQLFGRVSDELSHVLVSPEVENHPEFYYKPPVAQMLTLRDGRSFSTDDATIYLADIPFIRLQGAQSAWLRDTKRLYGEFVAEAQRYLDAADAGHQVKIDPIAGHVSVGESVAALSEYELLLYTLFARKRIDGAGPGRDGFVKLKEIKPADFDHALRVITRARGDEFGLERCATAGEWVFLRTVAAQAESAKPKDYKDLADSLIRAIGRANKALRKGRLPESYEINKRGKHRPYDYGLNIAPERIVWEGQATFL